MMLKATIAFHYIQVYWDAVLALPCNLHKSKWLSSSAGINFYFQDCREDWYIYTMVNVIFCL